jgi:restriction system protein
VRNVALCITLITFAVGWQSTGKASGGAAYALGWLATLAVGMVLRKRWRDAVYLLSGMRKIDTMSGSDFECYVAARFRSAGYRVSMIGATGDFGVDLIVRKGGDRIAVQCKRHARAVGTSAVQQVVAGAALHGCTSTMVVSNQEFTAGAIRLAHIHQCKLVGRSRLRVLPA